MAEPRIKYDIAANVSGDADVTQLANTLERLASTLDDDLKAAALGSAKALRELSAKSGAIDSFVALKKESQEAAQRLNEAQAAAQKLARELVNSDAPTRAQTGQLQKLRDAVRGAKDEVTANQQALTRSRATLQGYGVDTANLAAKQAAIRTAMADARTQVEGMVPAYQRIGAAAASSGSAQQRAAQQAGQAVHGLSDQVKTLESLQRTLQGTLAAVGVGMGIREISQAADAYSGLQSRIRLVTGEGENFTHAFTGVGEIAKRTGADLEQTGNLFARLTQAGKDAGQSTTQAIDQSLRLTETINQAIAVSGGSADASKAAITQLIQGLQSGVLRGDEFNSVMEQAPRLARALADGLGVTTGELRKMAEAGTLTSTTVIGALQSQAATLRTEYATLPPTIGRALQSLSNSWTVYIGEADKANGVSVTAARALGVLSENIGTVAGFLTDLGKAAAAFKLLDLASTLNAKATAAAAAARAIGAEAVATTEATAATRANTAATNENAAAKRAGAAATEASATANKAASASSLSVGQAFTQTATAAGAMVSRLAGYAAGIGAVWLAIDVGGDVLKKLGTGLGEGIAKLAGYRDGTDKVAEAWRLADAQAAAGLELRTRQNALNQEAIDKTFQLSKGSRQLIADFDGLVAKGNTAAEAVAKIGKDFDLSRVPGIAQAGAVLDKLQAAGKISADEFRNAWADALKGADLQQFEVNARAAFAGTTREAERLAQMLDVTAREAIKRTGLDFELLSGGMSKAARSAINDTQAIVTSLDKLKEQGVDVSRALTASIGKSINTADSEKALEAVRQQIESLRKTLGDKITDGLLDQTKVKVLELKDAADKATPGINSLREAFKTLGLQAPEDLKRIAATNKTAWDTIKADGTVGADQLKKAFGTYAESVIAAAGDAQSANRAITEGSLKTEAAAKGLAVSFDAAGKAIVTGAFDGVDAMNKLTDATKGTEAATRSLTQSREDDIAAQEKQLELAKREAALAEEKRTVRDTSGAVVNQGVPTLTSIVNQLKSAGLDPNKALSIAREFTDSQGNVPYENNPGQKKYGQQNGYGGTYDTLDMAVQRAAEKALYGGGGSIGGAGNKAGPGGVPGGQVPASSTSGTRTVNVVIGGRSTGINVASQADSDALVGFLRNLETSAGTAS